MAEANRSIPQIPTTAQARITTAAHVLAQLRARQAVKRELQAYGHKVSHYSAREITSWAMVYLADHQAELMPDAIATVERWMRDGVLGKRVQKEFIKHLGIEQPVCY
jgi:hypothetical protein